MIFDKDILDEKIEGTPFYWRDALRQGNTGVVAIPTETQIQNIVRQAVALHPVFNLLGGFTTTSWLRTPDHNKAVGGSPKSIHLLGSATDFSPTYLSVEDAKKKILLTGIYPGRLELDTTNWIHIDLSSNKNFYGMKR